MIGPAGTTERPGSRQGDPQAFGRRTYRPGHYDRPSGRLEPFRPPIDRSTIHRPRLPAVGRFRFAPGEWELTLSSLASPLRL